jgi:hypothetical protein
LQNLQNALFEIAIDKYFKKLSVLGGYYYSSTIILRTYYETTSSQEPARSHGCTTTSSYDELKVDNY